MSTLTQREQIIQYLETQLKKSVTLKFVTRRLATYEDLKGFASTQFPLACMVSGMPVAKDKLSSRVQGTIAKTISGLSIDCFIYLYDTADSTADSLISDTASELKKLILADPRQGKLVLNTSIAFSPEVGHWDPFVAFKITINMDYLHTTGGI